MQIGIGNIEKSTLLVLPALVGDLANMNQALRRLMSLESCGNLWILRMKSLLLLRTSRATARPVAHRELLEMSDIGQVGSLSTKVNVATLMFNIG